MEKNLKTENIDKLHTQLRIKFDTRTEDLENKKTHKKTKAITI